MRRPMAVDCVRAVYQESGGGRTLAPLDYHAHIVGSATPRLAKMVSSKYSKNAAPAVEDDLVNNHGRKLSKSYIKNLCDRVGYLIEEHDHEGYELPKLDEPVASVAIGLDGTCMLLCDDGWRQPCLVPGRRGKTANLAWRQAASLTHKWSAASRLLHELVTGGIT